MILILCAFAEAQTSAAGGCAKRVCQRCARIPIHPDQNDHWGTTGHQTDARFELPRFCFLIEDCSLAIAVL